MLFATQNPPGLYGGRKLLSKAFRNRFVELHFNVIPSDELKIILEKKCHVAPSSCTNMIKVMKELQKKRKNTETFAGNQGFITLRYLITFLQS